jgi:hypothetical protein
VADIYLPAAQGRPEIVMPPLSPPKRCLPFMEQRADDTDEVVRRRLEVGGQAADGPAGRPAGRLSACTRARLRSGWPGALRALWVWQVGARL